MNLSHRNESQDLYQMVDEVLYYVWDPIGVSDSPRTRGEYSGYVPEVFKMLSDGASAPDVALHLQVLVTENMGLSRNPSHALKVAALLLEWKEIIGMSPSTPEAASPPTPGRLEMARPNPKGIKSEKTSIGTVLLWTLIALIAASAVLITIARGFIHEVANGFGR